MRRGAGGGFPHRLLEGIEVGDAAGAPDRGAERGRRRRLDEAALHGEAQDAVQVAPQFRRVREFLKAEEAKKNKSDIWTVSAAETSKKESKALLVCFN